MIYNTFPIATYEGKLVRVILNSIREGSEYVQIQFVCTLMHKVILLTELE